MRPPARAARWAPEVRECVIALVAWTHSVSDCCEIGVEVRRGEGGVWEEPVGVGRAEPEETFVPLV